MLDFSLFDVTSAGEVPIGIPQLIQCILQGLTSVLFSSLLIVNSVNLVVARNGFLCILTEIVGIFHNGYL